MVKLNQALEGKHVRIKDVDGEIFMGTVGDYIYPEDNEPEGIASIVLDHAIRNDGKKYDYPVEFPEPDIKSIEIIE